MSNWGGGQYINVWNYGGRWGENPHEQVNWNKEGEGDSYMCEFPLPVAIALLQIYYDVAHKLMGKEILKSVSLLVDNQKDVCASRAAIPSLPEKKLW